MKRKDDAHKARQAKEKAKADKVNKPGGKAKKGNEKLVLKLPAIYLNKEFFVFRCQYHSSCKHLQFVLHISSFMTSSAHLYIYALYTCIY